MRLLFIGDIVSKPGRHIIKKNLPLLKEKYKLDFVIANAENAAGGNGLTAQIANELFDYGINFITMGNHTWDKKELIHYIENEEKIIRPLNYPSGTPGRGFKTLVKNNINITIVNIQGRIYMQPIDCPFRAMDIVLDKVSLDSSIIIVDFHAEATSEKVAMGYYLDGKVSAVLGTHTHIQTADDKILPNGTAYITDVGMTGPYESVLGIKKENIISRFINQMPNRFEIATGASQLNGIFLEINDVTGKALKIERIQMINE